MCRSNLALNKNKGVTLQKQRMEESYYILELDEKLAEIHKSLYLDKINECRKAIIEHEQSIDEVKIEIEKYKKLLELLNSDRKREIKQNYNGHNVISANKLKYNPNDSLAKKCEYILSQDSRTLSTREISELILRHEPDFLNIHNFNFDRLQKNVGSTLIQKVNSKKVFFKENINGTVKYGLISTREIMK